MLGNRSRDTKPEVLLRQELHRRGLRFFKNHKLAEAPTTADIVFPRRRVAIFVDGCFWHGCPEHYRPASQNAAYWAEKIARNQMRDRGNSELLRSCGWTVIRVWEHEDARLAAAQIERAVNQRNGPAAGTR